ncbi:flagellar hook-length control protein FliK [Massilia sp. G4R7]|uniref:Flagellar hook-length control protein FliK n=1 Tax=Massilia phyllostachyos TaxID=2898585 RepID=A0ABS8QA35_9BURK|nr:flagellar hook-length control protein FliK [Massilia phyllostachyos]MCD2517475.1 flagellar hook-length control protein FliK [Massilia phyllostachyos]
MNSAPASTLPASSDAVAPGSPAPADAPALMPAAAGAQATANPLAFFQFLDVAPAAPAPHAVPGEAEALPQAQQAAVPDEAPAAAEPEQEAVLDQSLLAAMAMPMMPSMMTMPAAMRVFAGMPEQPRAADAAPAAAAAIPSELPQAASARPAELPPQPAVAAPVSETVQPARAMAQPAAPTPQAAPAAGVAQPAASQAETTSGEAPAPANGAIAVAAPNTANPAPRETAALTLSGPPTAWRQPLREALGERLNLQVGKHAEQAVIRLEPPMLGRVEISIRHAAGSLEVNISATHGEVLRQLNGVSEQLRNDLAGRQYSDVSVNVTQAPRAQAMAQSGAGFHADAQGRGRQQEQQQDQQNRQPGAALLDAHQPDAAFSLNARA